MVTIHNCIQGSDEWVRLHDGLWTGSTAINLLLGKKQPNFSSFSGNKYTERGKLLESIALMEYYRGSNKPRQHYGFITNSKYPGAGFSPDGIDGNTLLEVKSLNGKRHEDLAAGKIPLEYQAQIHFGLMICELKEAKLLAFNPEYEKQLTIIHIKRDEAIIHNIENKLFEWYNRQVTTPLI